MKRWIAFLLIGCGGSVASSEDAAIDSSATDTFVASDTFVATDTFVAVDTSSPRDAGWTDIIVTGVELSPWEGKTIWFIIQNRGPMPGEIARASAKIVGGVAKVTFVGAMPKDHFGVGVNVFIDLDNDMTCNGSDPVWFDIASNMFGTATTYTFKPSTASKVTCADIGK